MADHDQPSDSRPILASDEHHPASHHTTSASKRPHLPHARHHPPHHEADEPEIKSQPSEVATRPADPDPTPAANQASGNSHGHDPQPGQPVTFGSGPVAAPPDLPLEPTSSADIQPPKPPLDSKKLSFIGTGALVACLLLGGVWFQLHRDVYSLGENRQQVAHQSPPDTVPETLGANANGTTLALSLNLKSLSQGHYQAWIRQAGDVTSLGGFNTDTAGPIKNLDGSPFAPSVNFDREQPAEIFITIEAGQELVAEPSNTIILSGELQNGQAQLSFSAMNLSQAGGVYVLATPTNGPDSDEKSGLWFAKTDGQTLTGPGLTLPQAPAGWKYEAQLYYQSTIVAMGRFSQPDQTDEFNKYSTDPDQAPSFPGEDLLHKPPSTLSLEFPADLTSGDWRVVISVEPDVNGTDPTGDDIFFIQPLSANIAAGSESYKEYQLTFDPASLPTGSAELK